jgi:hypothetical protein
MLYKQSKQERDYKMKKQLFTALLDDNLVENADKLYAAATTYVENMKELADQHNVKFDKLIHHVEFVQAINRKNREQ